MPQSSDKHEEEKTFKALTLRLPPHEWERLKKLAITERSSIQELIVKSLNLLYEEKGLRPLKMPAGWSQTKTT